MWNMWKSIIYKHIGKPWEMISPQQLSSEFGERRTGSKHWVIQKQVGTWESDIM